MGRFEIAKPQATLTMLYDNSNGCQACFGLLGWETMQAGQEYMLNTFPLAVYDSIRIRRCRLLQGDAYRGPPSGNTFMATK